jgi:formate-dependent nitrite reductase membrane component NrfD
MTWEWPIAIDLWAAGLGGGAYFAAFLMDRFTGGRHKLSMKTAMLVGLPLVLLGVLVLILDLGEQLRFWHLLVRLQPPSVVFRPGSAMSLGTYTLMAYAVIGTVMLVLWALQRRKMSEGALRSIERVIEVLSWIEMLLAVLIISYTGVLLSATNQPLWARGILLPAVFVASAVWTGMALILIVAKTGLDRTVDKVLGGTGEHTSAEAMQTISNASAVMGVVVLVVFVGYLVWLASFSTPAAADALRLMVFGSLSVLFWVGVVLIGLVIPLVLLFASWRAGREAVVGTILASACLVLLGGFLLRLVVVLAGQMA